jgi:cellulose synthase/poly-beta-1,6-N-acetylglucosamine synthase-like glycosyltransferase
VFYDEQPVGLKVMFRQRLRWAKGHTLVCLTRYRQVLKSLFSPVKKGGSPHKISCYDISVNILPLGVISLGLTFVQMILLAIAPAFGYAAWPIWKDFFISAAESLAGSYLLLMLSAILLFVIERKRIPQMSFGVRLGAVLCMPLFMALSIPLDFISFFVKNLSWKTIPHIDTTNIDTIHQTVGLYKTDKKAETVPQNDIPNDFDLQKGVSDEQI